MSKLINLPILTIKGNNLPLEQLEADGFEWDSERKQFQAYVHELNEEEIQQAAARYVMMGATVKMVDQAEWDKQGLSFEEREPEVASFLKSYNGSFPFLTSLKEQLERKGSLSEAQVTAVRKCMARQEEMKAPKQEAPVKKPLFDPTYAPGTVLELSKFIASKIGNTIGYYTPHRNVEVLDTLRETQNAVLVKVKLSPRFEGRCVCCGRRLTNTVSKASGVGPECAEKYGVGRYELDAAKTIVAHIESCLPKEAVEMWIPRSQIRGVLDKEGKVCDTELGRIA